MTWIVIVVEGFTHPGALGKALDPQRSAVQEKWNMTQKCNFGFSGNRIMKSKK